MPPVTGCFSTLGFSNFKGLTFLNRRAPQIPLSRAEAQNIKLMLMNRIRPDSLNRLILNPVSTRTQLPIARDLAEKKNFIQMARTQFAQAFPQYADHISVDLVKRRSGPHDIILSKNSATPIEFQHYIETQVKKGELLSLLQNPEFEQYLMNTRRVIQIEPVGIHHGEGVYRIALTRPHPTNPKNPIEALHKAQAKMGLEATERQTSWLPRWFQQ